MKWFINKNKTYRVQVYGKLPVYKDYINVVTRAESMTWRNWMLNTFDSENAKIPDGLWGFIFQGTGRSAPVAGLIEQSSDGIREFPFSLFSVMEKVSLADKTLWHQIVEIIKQLTLLRAELKKAKQIETFYDIIATNMLCVTKNNSSENRSSCDFQRQLLDSQNMPPLFFVLPDLSGSLGFSANATDSGRDIMNKWSALS